MRGRRKTLMYDTGGNLRICTSVNASYFKIVITNRFSILLVFGFIVFGCGGFWFAQAGNES